MELSLIKRIENIYPSLGNSSKKIADYLTQSQVEIPVSIRKLSDSSQVSVATISRFIRQLGYQNYSEFKWNFANQMNIKDFSDVAITEGDSPMIIAKKTLDENIATLNGTFELMQDSDLRKARDLIVNANKLAFFGLGGSNIVALDAYHKFLRVPLTLVHDSEYHLALMQATRLSKNDCAIVISHTGTDVDTLAIAQALQENQVPMIIITSFPKSPLAAFGEVKFFSISEDFQYRSEALISLTSQIAINDCLYMLVAQYFGNKADQVLQGIRKTISKKHPK
ncbi:MurR/RpiR family transcriptional regulator [Oenococcus oeni]|uniref:RpiR family transcriptional regulator n=2 Tax=Oenococcus oeni TaxID=1247 RepID=A0A483BNG7_OENOE|nr:MurR/RpiR family transcriptional regulator [Oenococcus oeni]MDV7714441.1 SIS domain-containing protein [Oenococcus oeni]OIM20883.1 RpiR family transcriptional regulator [Oenococcus oeni]SYW05747.1 Transcriptional regulator, RpiR family [Oenococcus oeni]SYW19948.1 Transcriptional regulator, RpiR family [Oenococcus oeni]